MMRTTLSLIRREFTAYFLSPVGYVALVLFLAGMGVLFQFTFDLLTAPGAKGIEFPMQGLLGNVGFWLIFWVIPSLLTMRLFAEERSTGTLEMLLTTPLRDWQIVLSKFAACFAFYVVMWLPTLIYLPVLLDLDWGSASSGIDPWPILTTYLGLALAGAMLLALGLFVSSLVRSQMVAALITLFLSLAFIVPFIVGGILLGGLETGGPLYQVLFFFTVPLHFERNFTRGLVD